MRAWPAACALLAGGAAAVGLLAGSTHDAAGSALAWNAVLWPLRPWTLWTSAFIHPAGATLLAGVLALAALAVLGTVLQAGRAAALALLLAWPLSTLALLLWPQVQAHMSLGGVLHAAAMVLWAHLVLHGLWRPLSYVLFAGMGLKLLSEQAWAHPVAFDPDWGFNAVHAAHLTGAAAGAVLGLALGALELRRGKAAVA